VGFLAMKRHILVGVLAGIAVGTVTIFLSQSLLFKGFELTSLNFRFTFQGGVKEERFDDVVIVDIDNQSLRELGRWQNWPRTYYADVIEYISQGGVSAIGFDVFFADYATPEEDRILVSATKRSGKVVHSFFFPYTKELKGTPTLEIMRERFTLTPKKGMPYKFSSVITPPIREIQEAASWIGHVNKYPDADGTTRSIPLFTLYEGRLYPTLAVAVLCQALDVKREEIKIEKDCVMLGRKRIPTEDCAKMWIKYVGGKKSFKYISFATVLKKRVPKEYFKGKIVIIGGSAEGLFDITQNPFSEVYPGVEIHANIIHNILVENFMKRLGRSFNTMVLFCLSIMVGLFSAFFSLKRGVMATGVLLLSYTAFCIILFEKSGLWMEMVSPNFSILTTFSVVWLYRFRTEERKKHQIKAMFSRYVNREVAEQLAENPESFELGGERKRLTVLFSDICGFTSMSEKMEAEKVVSILNEYFPVMNDIVFKYEGTLDKFIGDAIMVIYGAPIAKFDHAKRAVLTALEMMKGLKRLNEEWRKKGEQELDIGIGINTGEMVVGNIGSEIKTDYTVIGDEVNLASRLEGLTRKYDTNIIMSKATYEEVKSEIVAREVDLIRVKGKTKPVTIYEPVGLNGEVNSEKMDQLRIFEEGLRLYRERKWKDANKVFSSIMEDGIARMYFMRCQEYIELPPPPDWDGVYVYKTK
jgi:adenylate cyclase